MALPFAASQSDPTADLPGAESFGKLRDQWNTFLDQPQGRGALLSFGMQLMQPPSFGDTAASQIGRAIGAGGESVGRTEAMDIKQQEADTKAMLREAQAGAAGARAGTQAAGMELAREKLQSARTIAQLKSWNDLTRAYNTFKSGAEARNLKRQGDILNPNQPLEQIPDMHSWVASNPSARAIAEASGLFGSTPSVGGSGPVSAQDQEALTWATDNPNDPRAAQIRARLGR